MNFVWPGALWGLLSLPLLVWAYVVMLRRQRRAALPYPHIALILQAQTGRRPWRRHLPPLLLALAWCCALVGLARPLARVTLPADYMTLMLAMDVSRSMLAQDVPPSRMEAAQAAAKTFLSDLPARVRVGIVTFAASAQLAQDVTDSREALLGAIDRFQLQRGTATGSGLLLALATLRPDAGLALETAIFGSGFGMSEGGSGDGGARAIDAPRPQAKEPPKPVPVGSYTAGAIILLSDGRRTSGPDPLDIARRAADLGVRVHTVAFGTADGVIPGLEGYSFYARVDEETLQAVAKTTGGEFYRASNAEDLGHIYDKLSSQIALETRLTEVSVLFAALALALVLSALGLSLRWFRQAR